MPGPSPFLPAHGPLTPHRPSRHLAAAHQPAIASLPPPPLGPVFFRPISRPLSTCAGPNEPLPTAQLARPVVSRLPLTGGI
ncbi:hypothetical protein E2562_029644 [Oryza meyeriana var. granulata]|uniref:Uncharacterized protein n=1 Tax=Oryza meyeriana var. granulata TaxID=110450 RepID=A0A6G1FDR2_9ORYZ|nr:hypothetical protein E2562_029644 [Oryza meyeriana var. granulata]